MDCQPDSPFFSPHTSNLAARAGMMFKKSHTTRNVRKHAKLFFPKPVLGSCAIVFLKAAPPVGCTLNRTVIHRTKTSNRQYHNMCQKHFKNKIALHDSTHTALIFFLADRREGGWDGNGNSQEIGRSQAPVQTFIAEINDIAPAAAAGPFVVQVGQNTSTLSMCGTPKYFSTN